MFSLAVVLIKVATLDKVPNFYDWSQGTILKPELEKALMMIE